MRVFPNASLPVSPWHNGAGRKADVVAGDGWLVSFAWLDADAPFSRLPDMDRTITLVEGPGFTLDVAGRPLPVSQPVVPTRFDGGASVQCRVAGPSRVLNVMTDRTRFVHAVTVLTRSAPIDPAGNVATVLVALSDASLAPAGDLAGDPAAALLPLDAASLDHPATLRLTPDARALLLTIRPAHDRLP